MNNTIVSPAEYFEQVKSRKQTMTTAGLSQLYENCLALLEEYQRSGQIAAVNLSQRPYGICPMVRCVMNAASALPNRFTASTKRLGKK